jgi:two-component system response regulator RegX3
MKANVLIIEDEAELAELMQIYLGGEGIDSTIAATAEEGLNLMGSVEFDLVLLDINLPGMDGFELLQKIRPRVRVPVIIVSSREADEDIVMGLGVGADEFVTKPFTPRVLVARVRALLRRVRSDGRQLVSFGPYVLDAGGYFLSRDGKRVPLASKEIEVLRHLALHPGRAMTPEEIYSEVWGNEYGDTTSVAVYILRIRRKIEDDPANPRYIQTIHGKGYRLNPESIADVVSPS